MMKPFNCYCTINYIFKQLLKCKSLNNVHLKRINCTIMIKNLYNNTVYIINQSYVPKSKIMLL